MTDKGWCIVPAFISHVVFNGGLLAYTDLLLAICRLYITNDCQSVLYSIFFLVLNGQARHYIAIFGG